MANPASRKPRRSFAIGSGRNLMFSKASVTVVSKALSFEKLVSTLMAMTVDKKQSPSQATCTQDLEGVQQDDHRQSNAKEAHEV